MILEEPVTVKWVKSTRSYYESLGYIFTKWYDSFTVLSTELTTGSTVKITAICDSCGNTKVIQRHHHNLNGDRYYCELCRGVDRKHTIDYITEEIKKRGYVYVSGYKNAKSLLQLECVKHGTFYTSWDSIKSGKGCTLCGRERTRAASLTTIDVIEKTFATRGYILLSTEYNGTGEKLSYICPKHPFEIQKVTLPNFNKDRGCRFCGREKIISAISGNKSLWWVDGSTSIKGWIRQKLTYTWVCDSIKAQNNKCFISGKTKQLEVHHGIRQFNDIFYEVFSENQIPIKISYSEYSQEELTQIQTLILEAHYKYGHGLVLYKPLHKLFHKIYGKKNTTLEQLLEFKDSYLKGDFDDPPKNRKRNESTNHLRHTTTPDLDQPRESDEGGYREAA